LTLHFRILNFFAVDASFFSKTCRTPLNMLLHIHNHESCQLKLLLIEKFLFVPSRGESNV
jgi:hypothetical protein